MEEDKKFLAQAINLAKESVKQGGFPAGAVVVKNGKVIAEGISIGNKLHDPTSHAETAAIRNACQKLNATNLAGATLYESVECCVMCFSVANWAGISRIVYGCKKNLEFVANGCYEGVTNNEILNKDNNRKIKLVYIADFEKESKELIETWIKSFAK